MADDNRTIYDLHEKIGHMNGLITSHLKQQDIRNEKLDEILEKMSDRIDSLDTVKKQATGFAVGAGLLSGSFFSGFWQGIKEFLQ